jgi:hypothetical protein
MLMYVVTTCFDPAHEKADAETAPPPELDEQFMN